MNLLGAHVNSLGQFNRELELIRISHNGSSVADPVHGVEDDVLIGPTVDSKPHTVAPSGPVASNTTFFSSALEPDPFTEEWESLVVLNPTYTVVR